MSDLDTVIERIHGLAVVDEDDIDPPPSAVRIACAIDLCRQAARLMVNPFPRATPASTDDGGVDIYWQRPGDRAVSVCTGEHATDNYLYHRLTRGESGIEQPLTPELIAHWLDWYAAP